MTTAWTETTLGEVMTLQRGFDLPASKRRDGPYPIVSSSGVTGFHDEFKVEPPGVVTGRYGTLGEVFYVTDQYWPLNTSLWVKDFKGHVPRFVKYFLRHTLRGTTSDKAAVPGVNRNDLHTRPVRLPPLPTQRRIADVLSAYDDLIENNRRRIQLLEQAARMIYKEWFVRLRFPGHEHVRIVDGVPEGWERKELGELCLLRAGSGFKPRYQGRMTGDLPFIKVSDMNSIGNTVTITEARNWVTSDECTEFRGKAFPPGTSVFAKIGEALKKNRVRLIVRDTLIDNNMMGAIPNRELVGESFLYYLLNSYDIARNASGAAVPFLSAKVLSKEPFLVPDLSTRHLLDSVVVPMLEQTTNLQRDTTIATAARDILLPRLMNGEIEV